MKRVLLKLSGEALARRNDKGEIVEGFRESTVRGVARQVKELQEEGLEIGIVIGGGNFWRGRTGKAIDRSRSDQIGMLATVMNAFYVSEIFRQTGMETLVLTPFACGAFTQMYSRQAAVDALEKGCVVFFAGGTGHPFFSTDTAAALRAVEIGADMILCAKSIDGVYSADPNLDPDAVKYETISIGEVVSRQLKAMDLAANVLCLEQHMPMLVFLLDEEDSIVRAARGAKAGSFPEGTFVTVD